MYKAKIVDIQSGEEIVRDYTLEELAEAKNAEIEANERVKQEENLRVQKLAVLEKLGITEEEAKVLFA